MTDINVENTITFIEFPASERNGLARVKSFYQSVFGWVYKDWGDDYADTGGSGLASGINADAAHRPEHALAVIYVGDLEAVREKVRSTEGTITREIFSFPGGRRFHFKDPAGNELGVWSDK